LNENRIDFYAKADYTEDSEIDKLIKYILSDISIKSKLRDINKMQLREIEKEKISQ